MARKRGHGEGSIYQEGEGGRWVGSVSLGYDADGTRQRKKVYGKTRREVATKLLELQRTVEEGLPVGNDQITVGQLMELWLKEVVAPSVRPKTYRSYDQLVQVHIVPALGKERLAKVDARAVQTFLREKQESGLSVRTVQYLRAVLRRAFASAVRWDMVARNVVTLTDPPKGEQREPRTFTPEQAQALLKAFSGHRFEALFTVTLGLGLRIGEALGLRWSDIVLDPSGAGGTVTVRVQLQKMKGEYQLVPPKSRNSRRTLSLPGFVARALAAHRAQQREAVDVWPEGPDANPWDLAFTNTVGRPLQENNVRRDFYKLLAKAGLERLRLHDLRHLCASLLLSQGTHPRVIMEILGHSQIGITMNLYSHVMPGATKAAADALDGLLDAREKEGGEP